MNLGNYIHTTSGLIDALFNEMELLHSRRITPERARSSAALAGAIIGAANLEVTHHKMKPRRNGYLVRAVLLGTKQQSEDAKRPGRSKRKSRK